MRSIRRSTVSMAGMAAWTLLALSAVVPACKDDARSGESDGGLGSHEGGAGSGGTHGTGGNRPGTGGVVGGAGGASTGGAAMEADSGTGGGGTGGGGTGGGARGGSGGSDVSLDASPDAPSTDASVDAGSMRDGAPGGSLDASDGAVRLCPPNPDLPAGKYQLTGIAGYSQMEDATFSSMCALAREPATLTIVLRIAGLNQYDVAIEFAPNSIVHPLVTEFFSIVASFDGGKTRFQESYTDPSYPYMGLDLTIDNATGLIESFSFTESHYAPTSGPRSNAFNAVGWPKCAASDASPPSGLPAPPAPANCAGVTTPGCTSTFTASSTPACPSEPSNCSCKVVSDGYEVQCCTP